MNQRFLPFFCGIAFVGCSFLAHADGAPGAAGELVPVGPQVKVGQLPNGLTYYIQRNNKPEKKLELRLVVKAGSILEDEDQQGLAHFTEHMAFNGSTHFKKTELISYLQSIGVKFGADLNARTSFDETVYILPIPTDQKENIDTGFQVLEDWAHGLSMNEADIDTERGVVLEEARLGKGAEDRMSQVLLPKLLNGSRYAQRLPIGKEETLKTFKYDAVRRFYRDWYRPNLMAVVAVGDIDPALAEQLVQRHFAGLKNPVNERPRDYATIPLRAASEALVIGDKEATSTSLFIRYPIRENRMTGSFGEYRNKLLEQLYTQMLGVRLQELTQQANPPFIAASSGPGSVVHDYKSFNAFAVLGKAGPQAAIDALMQENARARQFGFSAAELARAKKNLLLLFERAYVERDKMDSALFAAEYIRNFLDRESIPGIANELNYVKQILPQLTLDEVNRAFRAANPSGEKKLVVLMGSTNPGFAIPAPAALLAAVDAAEAAPARARDEKPLAANLMEAAPKPGVIVAEREDKPLGLTELTFGNGVKVVLKPTDFQNDQVLLSAVRPGGQSLFGDADMYNARYASAIVGQMGIRDFSRMDIQKMMAGKAARAGVSLGVASEGISGATTGADLETMLQLLYLELTQIRKDDTIFNSFISKQQDMAKNTMARPESVFRDTIQTALYGNHPRLMRAPKPEDFDRVQLDRAMAIYKERFGSAKGFTFFMVGSFDVARVKPLLTTYLGALPAGEAPVGYRDLGIRPVKGVVKKDVFAGAAQNSDVSITFAGEAEYSEAEQMRLQALSEVLNIKLIDVLREQMGLIYRGGTQAALNKAPYQNYLFNMDFPCAPENVDKVIAAAFAEIDKVKDQGPLADDLNKVKQNWLKEHGKAMRENSYWMGRLQAAAINGTDPAAILNFEQRLRALTTDDIKAAAKRYLDQRNYVQVVLYPAK